MEGYNSGDEDCVEQSGQNAGQASEPAGDGRQGGAEAQAQTLTRSDLQFISIKKEIGKCKNQRLIFSNFA